MKTMCRGIGAAVLLLLVLQPPADAADAAALGTLRAVHVGGNWGRNPFGIAEQPPR